MSEKYANERTMPQYPACGRSHIHLRFNGKVLSAMGGVGGILYPAVSGKPRAQGDFDYSLERQKIADQGSIPEGEFWIQPSQFQENAWYRIRNPRFAWGNYWITIHPYPSTQTYGRGGFFIHGGDSLGSAGCIDLAENMNQFVEALKKELNGFPECFIPLTVKYSE